MGMFGPLIEPPYGKLFLEIKLRKLISVVVLEKQVCLAPPMKF
jgi:hypothetical protein